MNVSITPELQLMVQRHVASGRYNNASEVVREALRLFERASELREAQHAAVHNVLDQSIRELSAGDVIDGTAAIDELRRLADAAGGG